MADNTQDDSLEGGLGAALGDLSASAGDFQLRLDQLNRAISQLQESTDELCAQKAQESDSLETLADNLSHQPTTEDSTAFAGVSAVADD